MKRQVTRPGPRRRSHPRRIVGQQPPLRRIGERRTGLIHRVGGEKAEAAKIQAEQGNVVIGHQLRAVKKGAVSA